MNKLRILLYALTAMSIVSTVYGESLLSSLSITLCGIVAGVRTFVGIVAIALFLIGGIMYAIAHFIPTSVDFRKALLGWSTAMIVAAVIGVIVVILAQPLINLFAGFGNAAAGSSLAIGTC